MNFSTVFSYARGDGAVPPFPYQRRLAEGDWPDLVNIPTGLGKTAAIITAWLYKRLTSDAATPRRLVYCLPMRVLVEQVRDVAEGCVANVGALFEARGLAPPEVVVLMGGACDGDWVRAPEHPAIIVGTQDMLLSRALMRGYGMSRYRWPVDFAFLHNDALWVFDEVQLMGAGIATSAQLEAFRRSLPLGAASRTLWLSATLDPDWLATVDFKPHLAGLSVLGLDADPADRDTADATVQRRVNAAKAFAAAATRLTAETLKDRAAAYARSLAAEVLGAHRAGTTTLVILNRVDRAQAVFEALRSAPGATAAALLLIHSRFRPAERRAAEARLKEDVSAAGRIVVATQAIEAGVDITSATLFTELAPWASLVQRCGRCNRYGEEEDARIHWIDIAGLDDSPDLALPYAAADLLHARKMAVRHPSASPAALTPATGGERAGPVLRRKDLIELFNTDPDLSGFDIDISPYIRDVDDTDVHVFWRAFDKQPPADAPRPDRDELCPVAIGRFRDFLKKRPGAFVWDPLERRWTGIDRDRIRPGLVIMLDAVLGGYDAASGFIAESKRAVAPVPPKLTAPPDAIDDDRRSELGCFVGLARHLAHVEAEANALSAALPVRDGKDAVIRAARWHDVGKAHPVFQDAIADCPAQGRPRPNGLLAKSACAMARYGRRHFRHELASALAWLAHGDGEGRDLIAYLIAAHHGKVRLGIRALPGEREPVDPRDDRRFARGIWEGDALPAVDVGGKEMLPATALSLAVMELGEGALGESWAARTQRLVAEHGPFRLAWLEALVRIADWRASGSEQEAGFDDV